MAVSNLTGNKVTFDDGLDGLVITDYFQGKRNGAGLDASKFKGTYFRAGHIVIHKPNVEDSHALMPITKDGGVYEALPDGYAYYGFTVNSGIAGGLTNGIAVRGNRNPKIINPAKGFYDLTALIPAIQTALFGNVTFLGDND